jgi:hypothetical protein
MQVKISESRRLIRKLNLLNGYRAHVFSTLEDAMVVCGVCVQVKR